MPDYPLPDPLTMDDGSPVTTAGQWPARRAELMAFFTREMYGQSPGRPEAMTLSVFDEDPAALGGKATRRQVSVFFTGQPGGQRMDILLYVPNGATKPIPAFVGLNFQGKSYRSCRSRDPPLDRLGRFTRTRRCR